MAPKNKQRNGFYFFMKEMKDREAARGYIISMRDLPQIAHPKWIVSFFSFLKFTCYFNYIC